MVKCKKLLFILSLIICCTQKSFAATDTVQEVVEHVVAGLKTIKRIEDEVMSTYRTFEKSHGEIMKAYREVSPLQARINEFEISAAIASCEEIKSIIIDSEKEFVEKIGVLLNRVEEERRALCNYCDEIIQTIPVNSQGRCYSKIDRKHRTLLFFANEEILKKTMKVCDLAQGLLRRCEGEVRENGINHIGFLRQNLIRRHFQFLIAHP